MTAAPGGAIAPRRFTMLDLLGRCYILFTMIGFDAYLRPFGWGKRVNDCSLRGWVEGSFAKGFGLRSYDHAARPVEA